MTQAEANSITAQLGFPSMRPHAVAAYLAQRGLTLGLDNTTGDWVVLKGQEVVARVQ